MASDGADPGDELREREGLMKGKYRGVGDGADGWDQPEAGVLASSTPLCCQIRCTYTSAVPRAQNGNFLKVASQDTKFSFSHNKRLKLRNAVKCG